MQLPLDTRLGRLEIRSHLSSGSMGEVYLAWDSELERTVALKILPEPADLPLQELSLAAQGSSSIRGPTDYNRVCSTTLSNLSATSQG
jgi:serine/threonine protein kinase